MYPFIFTNTLLHLSRSQVQKINIIWILRTTNTTRFSSLLKYIMKKLNWPSLQNLMSGNQKSALKIIKTSNINVFLTSGSEKGYILLYVLISVKLCVCLCICALKPILSDSDQKQTTYLQWELCAIQELLSVSHTTYLK